MTANQTDTAPLGLTMLSPEEKAFILDISRRTIEQYLIDGSVLAVDSEQITPAMLQNARCFVTLHRGKALRGCIGHMAEDVPLIRSVGQSSISAAVHDYRFPPMTIDELGLVSIEISVLTPSHPLSFSTPQELMSLLKPGAHGVVLRCDGMSGLFLPQMWEHFAGEQQVLDFLVNLSHKAGDSTGRLWKNPRARYDVFEVIHFNDAE